MNHPEAGVRHLTCIAGWRQGMLAQYNSVFGVLLDLRITSWHLQHVWQEAVQQQGVYESAPSQQTLLHN